MSIAVPILFGALAIGNASYCASRMVADFRNGRRVYGVVGLLALAGIVAPIALAWSINRYGS